MCRVLCQHSPLADAGAQYCWPALEHSHIVRCMNCQHVNRFMTARVFQFPASMSDSGVAKILKLSTWGAMPKQNITQRRYALAKPSNVLGERARLPGVNQARWHSPASEPQNCEHSRHRIGAKAAAPLLTEATCSTAIHGNGTHAFAALRRYRCRATTT